MKSAKNIVAFPAGRAERRKDELAFLPAALEIVETPPSPVGRAVALTIIAVFAVALGWACIGTVDIVAVAPKFLEMTPFVIARAEAGERTVPAWLEVVPDQMRILVHSLPVRAQIDTQVQEQLIVEFYSK